jgi:pilus assembly protein CpaB
MTFLLALLLAGAASLLVLRTLQRNTVRASASTHRVVAAARDLEVGTKLAAADLQLADWAAGTRPEGSFVKLDDVVGRAVLYPVFRNELLLEAKVAAAGAGAGLPAVIPEGMRAVSIRVDDVVAVAGFVGPGTRVDVLVTGDPQAGRMAGAEPLTKVILENVQVLAAGQKIQPDSEGKPEKVNVVTLLCTPEDAARVTLAANDGRIQLVLRNPADKGKAEKEALVARRALYGGAATGAAPAPVKRARLEKPAPPPAAVVPAPPPEPVTAVVEIIRGQNVSKVELPKVKE